MEDLSSPLQSDSLESQNSLTVDSNNSVENSTTSRTFRKKKTKKEKKRVKKGDSVSAAESVPSSSSNTCNSTPKFSRLVCRRRNPTVRFSQFRRSVEARDVEAMALPLGMSFAAFVSLVLDRTYPGGQSVSIDDLPMICTSAVRESIANVYGDKFDCFVKNFETSFGSTLSTLRLINDSSSNKRRQHELDHLNLENNTEAVTCSNQGECSSNHSGIIDSQEEMVPPSVEARNSLAIYEEVTRNMAMDSLHRGLSVEGNTNQLACVTQSSMMGQMSTIEKSMIEQTRANDLKTLELSMTMEKMRLKRAELALSYDSNHLGRSKLAMGISKAAFEAEKFKNQLEDTRHAELLKKCVDCLVAGLLIMAASLSYSAYVHSYKRITEATESCLPSPQVSSWWIPKPMASLNTGLHTLKCQVQVVSRMLFGLLMIVAITYLLFQRSTAPKQTMPITFILLLLGIVCGFTGKLCVDTLGGSGNHWLLLWETLCLLHFFSNICTSTLFVLLYGPVNVTQGTKHTAFIPYWIRRTLFYASVLVFLPLFCGLTPFASFGEWNDHFSQLLESMWTNEGRV